MPRGPAGEHTYPTPSSTRCPPQDSKVRGLPLGWMRRLSVTRSQSSHLRRSGGGCFVCKKDVILLWCGQSDPVTGLLRVTACMRLDEQGREAQPPRIHVY